MDWIARLRMDASLAITPLKHRAPNRYISSFFVMKRGGTGRSDFFISGAGALRIKRGLSDQEVGVIAGAFKASSAEMPLGAVWDDVPIPDSQSIGVSHITVLEKSRNG